MNENDWQNCAPEQEHDIAPFGIRLRIHEWGDPEATPVVLAHGMYDHGRGYDAIAPYLAEHFRLLSVTSRGHGDSAWADAYLWPLEVADLIGILEWAGRPCHLIGHSRGGGNATDAAIHAPQFVRQLADAMTFKNFLVGMVKAPVFAFLIGLVGCYEGLQVGGSAESIGRLTTKSVVESIVLVILADATFSIVFSFLGI